MEPVHPDYAGACVANLVPALLGERGAGWLPEIVQGAETVVLLVVDGLGATALERHRDRVPTLREMSAKRLTTVVPSTTVVGLCSITTGMAPADHGIVGYRMHVGDGVLNVLRWKIAGRDDAPDPERFQPNPPFGGRPVPVITRAEYAETGFTKAHLRGARLVGAHALSDLVEHVRRLTADAEPFVYAYYGLTDVVAHMHGLRESYFPAELAFVDRLVADLLEALPTEAVLVVTSDHGHVHCDRWISVEGLGPMVFAYGGEGRFRSLYARPGAAADLEQAAAELAGESAWVFSRRRLFDEGWLGPRAPTAEIASRVGDVVIASRDGTFFADPTNPGEQKMISGHGSLTPDEMLVPLLAARGRKA